jgi:hypothetical protein
MSAKRLSKLLIVLFIRFSVSALAYMKYHVKSQAMIKQYWNPCANLAPFAILNLYDYGASSAHTTATSTSRFPLLPPTLNDFVPIVN